MNLSFITLLKVKRILFLQSIIEILLVSSPFLLLDKNIHKFWETKKGEIFY